MKEREKKCTLNGQTDTQTDRQRERETDRHRHVRVLRGVIMTLAKKLTDSQVREDKNMQTVENP